MKRQGAEIQSSTRRPFIVARIKKGCHIKPIWIAECPDNGKLDKQNELR